ncbi:MAG: hypothetical protein ACREDK_00335 [Thermoplasmata archaeon]
MTNVIIVGGSEETRLLLRGLLRLHRQRVLGEGANEAYLERMPDSPPPDVLVLDVNLEEPAWRDAVRIALRHHPGLRAVLLTPSRGARVEELAREAGIAALVRRPFAVHELIEAVAPASLLESPAGPGASLPPYSQT